MSSNRDRDHDRRRTCEVLDGGLRVDDENKRRNWLGHSVGSGAANIDAMLVKGVSRERLEAEAGRSAIREHLYQLRKVHGLPIHEQNGQVAFDRQALGCAAEGGARR
jgi:hypothetical protein